MISLTRSINDNVPALTVTLPDGSELRCVVDTGFSGELALPAEILAKLDSQPVERRLLRAPDGSFSERAVHETIIFLRGAPRTVEVVMTDGPPLIGTLLLSGMRLTIDIRSDGVVTNTLVSESRP